MTILAILAGALTGILLGLLGSGGSIITIPALIYLLGVDPKQAIAMSLGIVAITASITAVNHWRRGNVDVRIAVIFGLFGIVGTYAGTKLGVVTPVVIQLTVFAVVMYAAAYRMLKPQRAELKSVGAAVVHGFPVGELASSSLWQIAALGIGVGALTGFVGVGGGFLIVPALVLLSRMPMKRAVGTSLVIVAFNCVTGFAGYAGVVPINYVLMLTFTAVAIAGSFAGAMLSQRISGDALKRSFAIFLVLVATYILLKNFV
jgi:uncharacterized membrane protein YfcA